MPAEVPFPRLNDRRFFQRVMVALRVLEWAVPAALLAGLTIAAVAFLG